MKRNQLKSKLTLGKETVSNLNEIKGGKRPITRKNCDTSVVDACPSMACPTSYFGNC